MFIYTLSLIVVPGSQTLKLLVLFFIRINFISQLSLIQAINFTYTHSVYRRINKYKRLKILKKVTAALFTFEGNLPFDPSACGAE